MPGADGQKTSINLGPTLISFFSELLLFLNWKAIPAKHQTEKPA
jgi:hypothetical protein